MVRRLEREEVFDVVSVDVSDDYRVNLGLPGHGVAVSLTWSEAEWVRDALSSALDEASAALRDDLAAGRMTHGFDVEVIES